jgi:hypothetical protein
LYAAKFLRWKLRGAIGLLGLALNGLGLMVPSLSAANNLPEPGQITDIDYSRDRY